MRGTGKSILLTMILACFSILLGAQGQAHPPLTSREKVGLAQQTAAVRADSPLRKGVLLLFPYQAELPHHKLAAQTFQEEFGRTTDLALDLYFEYMDLNRFPEQVYQQEFLNRCVAKYGNKPVDLVIVTRDVMLDLWLTHRDEILPNAPVIFYDIVSRELDVRRLPPDVIGVSSRVDYTESLDWILRVRPSVNEIVLLHGVGVIEQGETPAIDDLKNAARGRVQITSLSDLPLAEVEQRVASLPETSVVLYTLISEDVAGNQYHPIDALRELAEVSTVPVISGYDQFIGTGTIGGYMYSIEQQARQVARMGLRVLRGEPASAIPIATDQGNQFIFDHLALQRYEIPLSSLPPDSIVKNRQYSLWELYRPQIIGIITGFVGLVLLIVVLTGLNRRLRAARQALSQLNVSLETQVQERTAALSQTNHLLEASNADLQAFAHTVAHDLKSPLSVLIGFSKLLESDAAQMLPEEIALSVHRITKTGYKMRDIVNALLLFASVREADEVEQEQLDMSAVVAKVLERLAPDIEAARAEIVAPETWPTMRGYAPWIEEVWVNYISNALKYGGDAEAGVVPHVELGVCDAQDQAGYCLFVRDNGSGLAPEELAKVFAPFTRFHRTHAEGHGLGLSIVQRIVEKLGGQVGVDSAGAGQGCTFWFVLPSTS